MEKNKFRSDDVDGFEIITVFTVPLMFLSVDAVS